MQYIRTIDGDGLLPINGPLEVKRGQCSFELHLTLATGVYVLHAGAYNDCRLCLDWITYEITRGTTVVDFTKIGK